MQTALDPFISRDQTKAHVVLALMLDPRYMWLQCVVPLMKANFQLESESEAIAMTSALIDYMDNNVLIPMMVANMDMPSRPQSEEEDPIVSAMRRAHNGGNNVMSPDSHATADARVKAAELALKAFRNVNVPSTSKCLSWWLANEKQHPMVARVAKAIHCIPASQAGNERVFSIAGHLSALRRNKLGMDNLSNMCF